MVHSKHPGTRKHDLISAHHSNKFHSSLKCSYIGHPDCIGMPYNVVKLSEYHTWLTGLIDSVIGTENVDYMGPFNEDETDATDFYATEIWKEYPEDGNVWRRIPQVGVDTWGFVGT